MSDVPFPFDRPHLPPGLDPRSAAVLREIVEQFVETGEPMGSRTLSRRLPIAMSPATIRNVMADLTEAGLLFAPHTSAGRLPTERGLRLFVDGLLQSGDLGDEERDRISRALEARGRSLQDTLADASSMLSGLSAAAGTGAGAQERGGGAPYRVRAAGARARAGDPGRCGRPSGKPGHRNTAGPAAGSLTHAANYLNSRLSGRSLAELRTIVGREMADDRTHLDELSAQVVETGLATWATGTAGFGGSLIVRGQGKLLADVTGSSGSPRSRCCSTGWRRRTRCWKLLELAEQSDGVRIYIGAESGLFGAAGISMVVAPARNDADKIVGAIGVIGPTRINYGRIIPVVDYTARVIGRLLG